MQTSCESRMGNSLLAVQNPGRRGSRRWPLHHRGLRMVSTISGFLPRRSSLMAHSKAMCRDCLINYSAVDSQFPGRISHASQLVTSVDLSKPCTEGWHAERRFRSFLLLLIQLDVS
jgi:hypothetical protein